MKIRRNRIYPYPVLSTLSDNFINNTFISDMQFEYDSVVATITIRNTIEDQEIVSFISKGLVKLFCHVECSVTKYRNAFEIPANEIRTRKGCE